MCGGGCRAEPAGPGLGRGGPGCPGRLLRGGQCRHLALAGVGQWTLAGPAVRLGRELPEPHVARPHRAPGDTPALLGPRRAAVHRQQLLRSLPVDAGTRSRTCPASRSSTSPGCPSSRTPGITHTIGYSFNETPGHLTGPVTILTYGSAKLVLEPSGKENQFYLDIENSGTSLSWPPPSPGGSRSPISTPTASSPWSPIRTSTRSWCGGPGRRSSATTWAEPGRRSSSLRAHPRRYRDRAPDSGAEHEPVPESPPG